MIAKVLSVYDLKALFYASPFYAKTEADGVRMFQSAVANPDILFSQYPEDFALYHIGDFDDNSGKITPLIPPVFLARGNDFKKEVRACVQGDDAHKV